MTLSPLTRATALALTLLLAATPPAEAAKKTSKPTAKKPSKPTAKPAAMQTVKTGDIGAGAQVNIEQVIKGVDPRELAKVLDLLNKRDADARKHEQRAAELEKELEKARSGAVSRVFAEAAQPQADDLAKRAREALLKGDTALAEQLLRQQEDKAAEAAQAQRHEAAGLARQIAALAIGRDSQAALAALERAARHEPEDFRTHIQLGDAQAVLGQSAPALASYETAQTLSEQRLARALADTPDNLAAQRDLSVSHNMIGDVLVAQGDGPGALAVYRKSLAIREALAARDPANTEWQRDLSVSYIKIGDVLKAQGDGPGALAVYRKSLAIREALAARDPANAEWQRDLIVSNVKLSEATGDKTFVKRALAIAEAMRDKGILAQCDAWMVDDLRRRVGTGE